MGACPFLCWRSPALKHSPYLPGDLPEDRWGSFVGTRNSAGWEPNGKTPLGQNAHPGFSSLFSQTEGVAQGPKARVFPRISAPIHDPHSWATVRPPTPKSFLPPNPPCPPVASLEVVPPQRRR